MVRPYTNHICAHWRFVDEPTARKSADTIYQMFCRFKEQRDFIGMDMARKFLEMGFTRARRYANHSSGRKYDKMSGKVRPQESDWRTNTKAKSATILRKCEIWLHTILHTKRDEKSGVPMNKFFEWFFAPSKKDDRGAFALADKIIELKKRVE